MECVELLNALALLDIVEQRCWHVPKSDFERRAQRIDDPLTNSFSTPYFQPFQPFFQGPLFPADPIRHIQFLFDPPDFAPELIGSLCGPPRPTFGLLATV